VKGKELTGLVPDNVLLLLKAVDEELEDKGTNFGREMDKAVLDRVEESKNEIESYREQVSNAPDLYDDLKEDLKPYDKFKSGIGDLMDLETKPGSPSRGGLKRGRSEDVEDVFRKKTKYSADAAKEEYERAKERLDFTGGVAKHLGTDFMEVGKEEGP
jgi:hypothetical protein